MRAIVSPACAAWRCTGSMTPSATSSRPRRQSTRNSPRPASHADVRGQRRHGGSRVAAKRALRAHREVIAAEPDHGRALGYGAAFSRFSARPTAPRNGSSAVRCSIRTTRSCTSLHVRAGRLGDYGRGARSAGRFIDNRRPDAAWFDNDTDPIHCATSRVHRAHPRGQGAGRPRRGVCMRSNDRVTATAIGRSGPRSAQRCDHRADTADSLAAAHTTISPRCRQRSRARALSGRIEVALEHIASSRRWRGGRRAPAGKLAFEPVGNAFKSRSRTRSSARTQ